MNLDNAKTDNPGPIQLFANRYARELMEYASASLYSIICNVKQTNN